MKECYEKLNELHKQKLEEIVILGKSKLEKEMAISQLQTEIALKLTELKNKDKVNTELNISLEIFNRNMSALKEKADLLEEVNKNIKEDYDKLTVEHLKTMSEAYKSFRGANETEKLDIESKEMKKQDITNDDSVLSKYHESPITLTQKLLDDFCSPPLLEKRSDYSLVQLYNNHTCPYSDYFDPALQKGGESM